MYDFFNRLDSDDYPLDSSFLGKLFKSAVGLAITESKVIIAVIHTAMNDDSVYISQIITFNISINKIQETIEEILEEYKAKCSRLTPRKLFTANNEEINNFMNVPLDNTNSTFNPDNGKLIVNGLINDEKLIILDNSKFKVNDDKLLAIYPIVSSKQFLKRDYNVGITIVDAEELEAIYKGNDCMKSLY